jgi:hypothetical protein
VVLKKPEKCYDQKYNKTRCCWHRVLWVVFRYRPLKQVHRQPGEAGAKKGEAKAGEKGQVHEGYKIEIHLNLILMIVHQISHESRK